MIKNKIITKKILEMLETLIEAGEYIYKLANEELFVEFEEICSSMIEMLNCIYNVILDMKNHDGIIINTDIQCKCAIDSINRINMYSKVRSLKLIQKIEFELIPLLQEIRVQFYFWGYVSGDKEREDYYYKNEMIPMTYNKYIDKAEENKIYKYDLSIIVTGYNKLDYTKLCIESLLNYIPQEIKYELILINHGSTDNTKEYFEHICPTKQIDLLKNGGGISLISRIVEGKYSLNISNDVIVTKNAIKNMLACMDSDSKIAFVVPSTPNVSNLQALKSKYKNIKEMHEFAVENNISDSFRWEQRVRLCNPIDLKRNKVYLSSKGIGYNGYFHTKTKAQFPDDKQSLLLRRHGYKMMLAKDAYCYHFKSITINDETSKYKDNHGNKGITAFYLEGRKEFLKAFGVDPWGIGFCWEPELFKKLPCNEKEAINVLGINCGFGSNPLKVKESIKENVHNLKVKIYNITDEHCYIQDLKGVSDIAEYVPSIEDLNSFFSNEKFKYIIIESKFETYENPLKILEKLKNNIVEDGILAIKIQQKELKDVIKLKFNDVIESGQWMILKSF